MINEQLRLISAVLLGYHERNRSRVPVHPRVVRYLAAFMTKSCTAALSRRDNDTPR